MSKNQNAKISELQIPIPPIQPHNQKHNDVTAGNSSFENRRPLEQSSIQGKSPVHTIPATDDIKQILLGLDQQKMMLVLNKLNENGDFRPSMKIDGSSDDDIEYV